MRRQIFVLVAMGAIFSVSGFVAPAYAAPKKKMASCGIKGGRAPCSWVESCLLDGGIPERKLSGKLVCVHPKPVPDVSKKNTPSATTPGVLQ